MNVYADAIAGALDLNLGDSRTFHAFAEHFANSDVLLYVVAVTLALLCAVSEPP